MVRVATRLICCFGPDQDTDTLSQSVPQRAAMTVCFCVPVLLGTGVVQVPTLGPCRCVVFKNL